MRPDVFAAPSNEGEPVDPGIGVRLATDTLVGGPENLGAPQLLDRIRECGRLVLRVTGGSMGPWFVPGDFIVVQRVEPQGVRRGNVIVFLRGKLLIAHRVIKVLGADSTGELRWKTKGDSAEEYDAPVVEKDLVGRVTFIQRAGRSFSLESPRWVAIGWTLSYLSRSSRFWYPVAHSVRRLCNPHG